MKRVVNFFGGTLLGVSLIGSLLMPKEFFFGWTIVILILAFPISMALGVYWASKLKTVDFQNLNDSSINKAIEAVMRSELVWLQGIRPRGNLINAKLAAAKSPTELISRQYTSGPLLGIAILGGGALISIGLDPLNGHGIFGALLATSFGRAIAVAIALYLFLSSASAYFAGLFLFKSKGA